MKRMTRGEGKKGVGSGVGILCLLALLHPTWTAAQARSVQGRTAQVGSCSSGITEGSLGITGLDCVGGNCGVTIWDDGRSRAWSFSTEPRVVGVKDDGPTDGVLEPGDFLVAVDGMLITTQEGGRRYAMLQPGERVRLRYRRDGRTREALVEVEARCRELPGPVGVAVPAAPLPDRPDEPRAVGIAVAPKVRVLPPAPDVAEPAGVAVSETAGATVAVGAASVPPAEGLGLDTRPMGRLGVGFSCSYCGTRSDPETGRDVWFFSGPLEVTAVQDGGPAARAGIRMGDLITAIDGKPLDTEEGGRAFTDLTPGERVRLTLLKRNGSETSVGMVPEDPRARVPRALATVTEVASRVPSPREPRAPDLAEDPAVAVEADVPPPLSGALDPPEGLPFRYSGIIEGVEVEVRGTPVTVSEVRGARTFIVNADGLWIRITVPARRQLEEGRRDAPTPTSQPQGGED